VVLLSLLCGRGNGGHKEKIPSGKDEIGIYLCLCAIHRVQVRRPEGFRFCLLLFREFTVILLMTYHLPYLICLHKRCDRIYVRHVLRSGDFGTCFPGVCCASNFGVNKMMTLKALIFLTILFGLLGVLLKRNLLLKILAMDVMGTGIISLFVLASSRSGMRSPIAILRSSDSYADPVPQAVILTAIVIGFSVLALLLVCATALARKFPTMDTEKIERRHNS